MLSYCKLGILLLNPVLQRVLLVPVRMFLQTITVFNTQHHAVALPNSHTGFQASQCIDFCQFLEEGFAEEEISSKGLEKEDGCKPCLALVSLAGTGQGLNTSLHLECSAMHRTSIEVLIIITHGCPAFAHFPLDV